jgi:predicted ATPase
MLQEVAYETLPEKYRKFYHFAVAKWLAERASPDFNVMIARHFEQAGNMSSALRHYQFALDYAEDRGAVSEADWLTNHIRSLRRGENESI